jgi:hypothetical protein
MSARRVNRFVECRSATSAGRWEKSESRWEKDGSRLAGCRMGTSEGTKAVECKSEKCASR